MSNTSNIQLWTIFYIIYSIIDMKPILEYFIRYYIIYSIYDIN